MNTVHEIFELAFFPRVEISIWKIERFPLVFSIMTAHDEEAKLSHVVAEAKSHNFPVCRDLFGDMNHMVLDLDHTLISSYEFGESPVGRRDSEVTISPILIEEYKDELGLPQMYHATISNVVVLIKLRPFVRSFIRSTASKGITLHVYTKGRRAYMNEVIRLIDPDGLIRGRRISRDDEPEHVKENQKDIALVHEGIHKSNLYVMVLDDSPAVWSSCLDKIQLMAAKRYTFSDKFVLFLRSMERGVNMEYPVDSDDFLESITISKAPLVYPSNDEEEDETFTPVNVWTSDEKPLQQPQPAVCEAGCAVIKVARTRFH
jgi:hypothetical protein